MRPAPVFIQLRCIAASPHASSPTAPDLFCFCSSIAASFHFPFDAVIARSSSPTVYAARTHDASPSFFGMRRHPSFFVQTLSILVPLELIRFEGVCCKLRVFWYFSRYFSDFI
jgi:hypothetical protein